MNSARGRVNRQFTPSVNRAIALSPERSASRNRESGVLWHWRSHSPPAGEAIAKLEQTLEPEHRDEPTLISF
ncbi:hypothetical protein [Phormidium sp. CCY1219]|uniref:hypothetical protein n=1 Tax=Phormidium sp. CCY1219 TaxID=2886104 RepID=UPI002D1EFAC9|nr:hypothetical protein [Phormidium sp. CCY1219]MEB3828718.1 hypothetical protein [Phormidium sp. CCY1219]